jgi:preprotein translocase subunit SecG
MLLILNVIYVLIAIAMVALILMQRGAGAQAGSGFGGGASATVFGARGSANFLSKATKWLAVAFFLISLFMAYQATNKAQRQSGVAAPSAGMMAEVPSAPTAQGGNAAVPTVPAAPANSSVPQAPAAQQPPATQVPAAPAPTPAETQAPATTQSPESAKPQPPAGG